MKYFIVLFFIIGLFTFNVTAIPFAFENGCIPLPCPFPAFCSAWTMGTYTLENGTVCPGCPICTNFNWPNLSIEN